MTTGISLIELIQFHVTITHKITNTKLVWSNPPQNPVYNCKQYTLMIDGINLSINTH